MIKSKKKLFIVKFTKGNNCFFQFYPSHFSVKDLKTRRIVLQVTKPDGLYPVKLSLVSPRRLLYHLLLLSTLLYPPPLLFGIVASVIHSPTSWDVSPFQTLQVIALPSRHVAKSHKFSTSTQQLLFLDAWGPYVASHYGLQFYVFIVDYFPRYSRIFPMSHKSQASDIFLTFKSYVELQLCIKIKSAQTDEGREFGNHQYRMLFSNCGI